MTTLRELSSDMLSAMDTAFDVETGELHASFEELRQHLQDKATSIGFYILDMQADVLKIQRETERLTKLKRHKENKIDGLKRYLAWNMKETGTTDIHNPLLTIKLQIDRDKSVELDAEQQFPASLCHAPKAGAPNKQKIKEAIEAGEYIAGARLVKKDRLTIK